MGPQREWAARAMSCPLDGPVVKNKSVREAPVPQARGRFAVVFLVVGILLGSGRVAHSQEQSIAALASIDRPTVVPRACGDRWPVSDTLRMRLSTIEADHWDKLCAELRFARSATASPSHADVRPREDEDDDDENTVPQELKAMGERGLTILRAREAVVEILQGQNRCAAWFEQAESGAVAKFRSLHYAIDETGPQYTLKIHTLKMQGADGGWRYQQPYVASSMENASAGSSITLNGRGAFFQLRSPLRIVTADGGPEGPATSQLLHLDVYLGGTLRAQVVALLHEYSHVVGLLPADGGNFGGMELSTQNTQTMLRHCRAQVEAAGKHKSSLVHPEANFTSY